MLENNKHNKIKAYLFKHIFWILGDYPKNSVKIGVEYYEKQKIQNCRI